MADKDTANKEDISNDVDKATNNGSNQNKSEPKKQAVLAPLPLEWTQLACPDAANPSPVDTIRYPWDVMDLPASCTEMDCLEIVGTSGQKVTRMGGDLSERYPNLESLVLRSHLIRTMDGLANFKKLEVLELYDNMIDELRGLNNESEDGAGGVPGRLLRVLDMSYNVIRDMGPVEFCPNLQELCE
jgi:Leucine-rich repeat (LRR) protein